MSGWQDPEIIKEMEQIELELGLDQTLYVNPYGIVARRTELSKLDGLTKSGHAIQRALRDILAAPMEELNADGTV